jgi:hypothetical protein
MNFPSGGPDLPFERILRHKTYLEHRDKMNEIDKETSKIKKNILDERIQDMRSAIYYDDRVMARQGDKRHRNLLDEDIPLLGDEMRKERRRKFDKPFFKSVEKPEYFLEDSINMDNWPSQTPTISGTDDLTPREFFDRQSRFDRNTRWFVPTNSHPYIPSPSDVEFLEQGERDRQNRKRRKKERTSAIFKK